MPRYFPVRQVRQPGRRVAVAGQRSTWTPGVQRSPVVPVAVKRRLSVLAAWGAYSGRMTVRVVFADDNYLVREGVAGLLGRVEGIDLVAGVAGPGAPHPAGARHHPPAVLAGIRVPPPF